MQRSSSVVLALAVFAVAAAPWPRPQDPRRKTVKMISPTDQRIAKLEREIAQLRAVLKISHSGSKYDVVVRAESVSIESSRSVRLTAGDDVKITANDDLTVESKDRLTLAGTRASLDGAGDLKLTGNKAELRAKSTLAIRGQAMLDLRGGIMKLNNGKRPIARMGDAVVGQCPPAGPLAGGKVSGGSPTVLVP